MKKLELKNIIYIFILIIMIAIPFFKLMSYFLFLSGIIESSFDLNQVYVLWFSIHFLMFTYIYGIVTKKVKINYFDYLIYGLIILGIISTIFAQDIVISIFGIDNRWEGLLSLVSYYLLFLNVKNLEEKHLKIIFKVFIILGFVQVVYSILQVYTSFSFIKDFSKPYMAMGLCANPNFLGSYMVMLLMISLSLYLLNDKKKYLILTIIFYIGLCLASSTGPFLSFILSFVFLIIVYFKKIKFKRVLIIIPIFILLFFIIDYSNNILYSDYSSTKNYRKYNIKDEIVDTVKNYTSSDTKKEENSRIRLWKNLIPVAKEYYLFGAGLDNLALVYPRHIGGPIYDKAHNIYYHTLLTNGIFALILYCVICFIIFLKGFRFNSNFYIAIYMAFVAYSIQGFANISVIDVAPYFFLILGTLTTYKNASLN